jgi:predicted nucleotidyltransferase
VLTVGEAFNKFKSRLEITATEQTVASRRQKALRAQVESEIGVNRDFLIGAYARDTKTKPLRDVDILFELASSERDYLDRPPHAVLTAIEEILVPHYGGDHIAVDRFCVRVDFGLRAADDLTDEVLSFDVVPAFADGDAYEIPDDRQGVWIGTNPESHASLATEANKALSGQWKPLIKMIKKWNDHNGSPVEPSFLLEVMGLALIHPPWGGAYPYELKQFFASAANRIDEGWPDPAKVGPDVSDVLDSDSSKMEIARRALREAEAACTEALRLEHSGSTGSALDSWQNLFGPTFAKS